MGQGRGDPASDVIRDPVADRAVMVAEVYSWPPAAAAATTWTTASPEVSNISFDEFDRVEIRVGTVVQAEPFERARKPMYRLLIDFGPAIGSLQTAAGLRRRYDSSDLVGRQVIAVLNLGSRNIAGFESQCLTLGVPDEEGEAILLTPTRPPTRPVPDGGKLF